MNEPTYGGLTDAQLWQAIAEAGCAEMCINARVVEDLLTTLYQIRNENEQLLISINDILEGD